MEMINNRCPRALLLAALIIAAFSSPTTALAQDSSTESTGGDAKTVAREHYKSGKSFYEQENYPAALIEFQAAYDTRPHPTVLKSLAECKTLLGDIPGAIADLEKFLAAPNSKGKRAVRSRIKELKEQLATLDLMSEPSGAEISLDGKDLGKITPATVELGPGEHEIQFIVEGYEPLVKNVTIVSGEIRIVSVDFVIEGISTQKEEEIIAPVEEEEMVTVDETPKDSRLGPPPVFWACAAIAGVGLVSGTVFGTMALGDEDDYKNDPSTAKMDAGERNAIIADVSFGVALAAGIVGTIILLTDKHDEEAEDEISKRKIKITPIASGNLVGVNTAISF